MSFANNVVHAGGIKRIDDAKVKGKAPTGTNSSHSAFGITVGTAAEMINPALGFSSLAAGGFNVLYWLSRTDTTAYNHFWTYMPGDENAEIIVRENGEILTTFLEKYFADRPIEGYSISGRLKGDFLFGVQFTGDDCVGSIHCKIGMYTAKDYSQRQGLPSGIYYQKAPDFVGGENVWVASGYIGSPVYLFTKDFKIFKHIDVLDIYQKASLIMKGDTYFYLAPNEYTYTDVNGDIVRGGMPLVVHKGKVHTFAVYEE
jgi:hypothetical protein